MYCNPDHYKNDSEWWKAEQQAIIDNDRQAEEYYQEMQKQYDEDMERRYREFEWEVE